MKKYLLLLLLASFSVEAQIVNIPDANFKAKLLEASPSNTIAQNVFNQNIKIDVNNDGEIQESEALLVNILNVSNAGISSMDGIQVFFNLLELRANDNNLTGLNMTGLSYLGRVHLMNNQINSQASLYFNSINTGGLELKLNNNLLTSFDLHQFLTNNVYDYDQFDLKINISDNPITNVNLNSNVDVAYLTIEIQNTLIESLVSDILSMYNLVIKNNTLLQLIDIKIYDSCYLLIEQNQSLDVVNIESDLIQDITVSIVDNFLLNDLSIINLKSINDSLIKNSPLTNLNIENCTFGLFTIDNIETESIDLSDTKFIGEIYLTNNLFLKYINVKNGDFNNFNGINCNNLPQLEYVCANEWQIQYYYSLFSIQFPNVNVNSYCSFTPGGEFFTIQGNSKLDLTANGCEENGIDFPNMKFTITEGTISGNIISNTSGDYSIPVQAGTHTITPVLENPTYFNVNPPSLVVTFPDQSSPFTQDFCFTPNGVHQDVEVTIIPINSSRPGFDSYYSINYKNKGTTVVSGTLSLTFTDNVMDFVSSNPIQSMVEPNILNWNYTDLQPFETREIVLTFNLNSPQETPALNGGEVLEFIAIVDPLSGDEMPSDNTSTLNQEVVNSFDPNDKTCLEGSVVSTELIGQYVHYVIRFENTGTFFAQNVVVKDEIDLSKFDLNSLIVLSASHQQWTRINDNKVEFIFENIQLPFPPSEERYGYIAFKIKLKNNLIVGDTFSNFASIYFDYNFPIITEPATTSIEALSNPDFEFSSFVKLYPNPASSVVTIESQTINLKKRD
jgi:hypothetical protein